MIYDDGRVRLLHGDCLDVLPTLPAASVDAVVTDPPYGLEFMGKDWDRFGATLGRVADDTTWDKAPPFGASGQRVRFGDGARAMRSFGEWCERWAAECLRVLKPGGHLLAFGGTRTFHRLAVAVEDAGFEIRDEVACLLWAYSTGFPKSLNVSRSETFCQCQMGESDHGEPATEHGLRAVLDAYVPATGGHGAGGGPVLLASLPEPGAPTARWAEPPAATDRATEPGMEGRGDGEAAEGQLHRAALREVPPGPAGDGPLGRLRDGAPPRDGEVDRPSAAAVGGGQPHRPQPTEQRPGEPGVVPVERGSQEGRGRPVCARCGKPSVVSGLGTALKPAWEPVIVARKPLAGTVAANVLTHGTGALNIAACRVGTDGGGTHCGNRDESGACRGHGNAGRSTSGETFHGPDSDSGRWPANLVLTHHPDCGDRCAPGCHVAELDQQSGQLTSGANPTRRGSDGDRTAFGEFAGQAEAFAPRGVDTGGASRFYPVFRYTAKAPGTERPRAGGVAHPTVKPVDLMRWLVRLVTPPGGLVLDPFAGSGTTGEACQAEGVRALLIEREADYLPLITQRLTKRTDPVQHLAARDDEDLGLFELLGGAE